MCENLITVGLSCKPDTPFCQYCRKYTINFKVLYITFQHLGSPESYYIHKVKKMDGETPEMSSLQPQVPKCGLPSNQWCQKADIFTTLKEEKFLVHNRGNAIKWRRKHGYGFIKKLFPKIYLCQGISGTDWLWDKCSIGRICKTKVTLAMKWTRKRFPGSVTPTWFVTAWSARNSRFFCRCYQHKCWYTIMVYSSGVWVKNSLVESIVVNTNAL